MPSFTGSLLIPLFAFFVLHRVFSRRRRGLPLPPGPPGLPFIGNLQEVATSQGVPWITYWKWSQTYGDIFHLGVLGQHLIVLNSRRVAADLLDKRSYNYSDRPDMPMLLDLMGAETLFGLYRYSDWWRLHRRTFSERFKPRVMPEYYDIQRAATASLMENLTASPENFFGHVRHLTGSIILKVIYGYTLQTTDDPYLRLVSNAMGGVIAATNHGSFWVDYLPALKYVPAWFPGASFKRKAKEWRRFQRELKEEPWNWVKRAMENGTAVPSFCTKSAERLSVTPGENSMMEDMIKNCAGAAYSAGADATVSAILSFILAMTLHPNLQTRAQEEIDSVVGSGRLPDFDDRIRLPFVNALLAETLRWNPVTPLAISHRAMHDDVYEGYYIPAGATVVANAWAILHDESLYGPNPMDFNPDRFLEGGGLDPPNPELFAFGFGRRICPGRHLALDSIYLTIVSLLSTFTIAKEIDVNGKECAPAVDYMDGVISHPRPFKCRFIARKSGGDCVEPEAQAKDQTKSPTPLICSDEILYERAVQ